MRDDPETAPRHIPTEELPGYLRNLHQRKLKTRACLFCGNRWPCIWAQRQVADARHFAQAWWYAATPGKRMTVR
jgi:hypothetical protein